MAELTNFLIMFFAYLILYLIVIAVVVVAVILGIKWRQAKDAKAAAVKTDSPTAGTA